eukprot:6352862-Alexandrium_andersonii.AAC.1
MSAAQPPGQTQSMQRQRHDCDTPLGSDSGERALLTYVHYITSGARSSSVSARRPAALPLRGAAAAC